MMKHTILIIIILPFLLNYRGSIGKIPGGSIIYDPNTQQYLNNYKAIAIHTDMELGQIIDYQFDPFLNTIKNLYIGTSIG